MNTSHRNLVSVRPGAAAEDVEVLLRNFFRSEMPATWPAFKAPVVSDTVPARSAPSRWTPVRSRLALAASVGFLMVGSWCLSSNLPSYGTVNVDPMGNGVGKAAGRDGRYELPGHKSGKNGLPEPKTPDGSAAPK